MKLLLLSCGALMTVFVAGCGSGGSNGGTAATYKFVTPRLNSQQIYAVTTVDNSNNTINQITRNTVTAVNSDGGYTFVHDDPSNDTIVVNGTNYSTVPETITDNNSGQELSKVANDSGTVCTVSPHGAGPDFPLSVGQSWTSNFSVTCGTAAPIYYNQTGSVVGVEQVTVPAGTFSAIKLQNTLTWTGANGATRTESVTTWRDVSTETVVRRTTNINYSGTPLLNSYPMSINSVLQSRT